MKNMKVELGDGGECYVRRVNVVFGEVVYNWYGGFWSF